MEKKWLLKNLLIIIDNHLWNTETGGGWHHEQEDNEVSADDGCQSASGTLFFDRGIDKH